MIEATTGTASSVSPPTGCGWLGTYSIRNRPLLLGTESRVRAELDALAAERGLGEILEIHGDVWGAGDVVVASPLSREDAVAFIERVDRARYTAIAQAIAVNTPDDGPNP